MNADNRLVLRGLQLFFLALLTGLLLVASPPWVANPRGVLAGHLEGAMNAMFLMLVGLFYNRVGLSPTQSRICRGTLLYSVFANWFFSTLSGILGAGDATPLAGAGHHASAIIEQLILVALVSVALTMLIAVVLLLIGMRRAMAASPAA